MIEMRNPGENRRQQGVEKGMSLQELLLVLVVVAAIALIVTPAFLPRMRSYKVRTAARQVQAELRLARTVAVMSFTSVTILFRSGEYSWTDAQGRVRRFTLPEGVSITDLIDPLNGDNVTFEKNGQVVGGSKTLTVDGWVRENVHDTWTVGVSSSGRTTLDYGTVEVVQTTSGTSGGSGGGSDGSDGSRTRTRR